MSDNKLDALFEGEEEPKPRLAKTWAYLALGMILTVLGLACTTLPGGLLMLVAWYSADLELAKLHSGYLPETAEPILRRQRYCVYAGLGIAWGTFVLQGLVLCGTDWYDQLLMFALYGQQLEENLPL